MMILEVTAGEPLFCGAFVLIHDGVAMLAQAGDERPTYPDCLGIATEAFGKGDVLQFDRSTGKLTRAKTAA